MSLIVEGRIFQFVVTLISFAAGILAQSRTRKGDIPTIKTIPAIDALDEAVNRGAETGNPIMFNIGYGYLKSLATLAALNILSHVGRLTAKSGSKIICVMREPLLVPLMDDILHESYQAENRLEDYDSNYSIRFESAKQKAMAAGAMGIINRENVVSLISCGDLYAESALIVGAGVQANCMRICALSDVEYAPMQMSLNDYAMIGDEMYAAGAYLTKNPKLIESIIGADTMKLVVIGFIAIGIILGGTGSTLLLQLMNL